MQDFGGKPLGYLSVIRDVSERVRVDNALRESERRNREFAADVAHKRSVVISQIEAGQKP